MEEDRASGEKRSGEDEEEEEEEEEEERSQSPHKRARLDSEERGTDEERSEWSLRLHESEEEEEEERDTSETTLKKGRTGTEERSDGESSPDARAQESGQGKGKKGSSPSARQKQVWAV